MQTLDIKNKTCIAIGCVTEANCAKFSTSEVDKHPTYLNIAQSYNCLFHNDAIQRYDILNWAYYGLYTELGTIETKMLRINKQKQKK